MGDLQDVLDAKGESYQVVEPLDWPFEALTFGADVDADCLAITHAGKPCTYTAYSGAAFCGTHQDAADPEALDWAHQWARIVDADRTVETYRAAGGTVTEIKAGGELDKRVVVVCVRCEEVWANGVPALLVDCPACEAQAGERCWDDTSHFGKAAPFPPHPARRRKAHMVVDGYGPCPANPLGGENGD